MPIQISISNRRITLTGVGCLGALAVATIVFSLPYFFAARLSPETAGELVRGYLEWKVTCEQAQELEASGMKSPDRAMALRWRDGLRSLENLKFESVEVKRAWIVPPLRRRTCFVIRVVIAGDEAKGKSSEVRYFWHRYGGTFFDSGQSFFHTRETSALWWRVPI